MENKRTVQSKQNKKKKRPKVKFNFWVMFIIFIISFAACFILYMLAANLNDNFFEDEFESHVVTSENNVPDLQEQETTADIQPEELPEPENNSITNPVPQSDAIEESYLDTACLVTDSTLIDMGSKGKFNADNVFGSAELNASNCISTKIETSFGTVSVYDLIKSKKPDVLYIMLGSDLESSSVENMIKNYKMLLDNLHSALPDMNIYVMQLPPVVSDTETLTNEMINGYNKQLLSMCNETGVYCIDTNIALKSGDGTLAEEYYSAETSGLSSVGYDQICQYIRTHIV